MRGVNRRRAASSDAAAASSPSDSDSEDDAAAKSGRLESDSEFSERRSGGMGGIPVGCAGLPGGATGTSSSAVKSIVAACSVRASCGSITASRHARRRRRPLLVRPAQQRSRSSAAYLVSVAAHRTSDGGTVRSHGSRQWSARCKTESYAAVLSSTLPGARRLLESKKLSSSTALDPQSSTSAGVARCKALSSTHYRGTITPRVWLAHQQVLQQRFTQEQYAVDAP